MISKRSAFVHRLCTTVSKSFLLFGALFLIPGIKADAAMTDTQKRVVIYATGSYRNWDGVSNVAQFSAPDGTMYYAIDSGAYVSIYKTNGGLPTTDAAINLRKVHSVFGTATCDRNGNFYLVTGENNSSDDTSIETVFISKYDRNGNHIATVGDNGSSSLAYYYDNTFYTKLPFDGGNCDVAIYGNVLTVMYAREMYSGHQSCSVISINTNDMSKVNPGSIYQSHSFAQRVVTTSDGFVYMSEGDAYDRAFVAYSTKLYDGSNADTTEKAVFDFWVEDGALDTYNMYVVNENFAHMGGLASLSGNKVAFAAQSSKSLSDSARTEKEDIFIQIFDPYADLDTAGAYTTEGTRSGLAGPNGRTNVTNYGVKWLTSFASDENAGNVQIVATDNREIVVLYEFSKGGSYKGVYYIVLDENGNEKRRSLYNSRAMLNPCVMPVYTQGKICWLGNKYWDYDDNRPVYLYSLDINNTAASMVFAPELVKDLVYNESAQSLMKEGCAEGGWLQYAVTKTKVAPEAAQYSEAVPTATDAGTYYIWYKVAGDTNHSGTDAVCVETRIDKAESYIYGTPGIYTSLTYSGNSHQLLYNNCYVSGGETCYALTKAKTAPGDAAYKKDIPTAKDAGTYYVWYKVKGDANHKDTNAVCKEVVIEKTYSGITKYPVVRSYNMTSNGSAQKLITPGEGFGGKMCYAVTTKKSAPGDRSFTTSVPTAVNSGTYYVWYKIKGDANHTDTDANYIVVDIAKGKENTPLPAKKGKTLTDSKNKAKYVVTSGNANNPTVRYEKSTNSKATSITIPATVKIGKVTYKVTSIKAGAFKGNKKIKKVSIGKNVTSIGDEAFSGCTKLTTVSIGAGLKSIGAKAFYNCSSLKQLSFPAKTIKLGNQFAGKCKSLKTITINSSKMSNSTVSNNAFSGVGKNVTLKVPKAKKKAYTKLFRGRGLGKKVVIKALKK